MLGRAAQAQAREFEGWVSVLTTLLEPVLILIMGGVVLFIVFGDPAADLRHESVDQIDGEV